MAVARPFVEIPMPMKGLFLHHHPQRSIRTQLPELQTGNEASRLIEPPELSSDNSKARLSAVRLPVKHPSANLRNSPVWSVAERSE